MAYNIEDLVRKTFFPICLAITLSKLVVAVTVKSYIDKTDHDTILSTIMAAYLPCLPSLLASLTNRFTGLDFKSLETPLWTSKQGVYLVILFNTNWKLGFRLYVGSSYGEQGLTHRVFDNHGNEAHRNLPNRRNKFLYELMAEPGTTWKFVCLAVFQDTVPKQLVLIAEAIMCSFFSSYGLDVYREFRLRGLPAVDCDIAVNRSDPLAPEGHLFTMQRREGQHRTLANALAGGPQNVNVKRDRNSAITQYQFNIFDIDFCLPKPLGNEWGLAASSVIDVTFDLSTTYHEFPYAILCENSDDGCHLGISISKIIKGIRYQWWLEQRTMEGIRIANSLVDWLNEKITDPTTFEWNWDRVPFFGPRSKVRPGVVDAKRQERENAAKTELKALVASRKRQDYAIAGANVIPVEINHGTKRKFEEIEDEEKENREPEMEIEEPEFSAQQIWDEQVDMTRKYLSENHKQMRKQGVDLPYFLTYRSYRV